MIRLKGPKVKFASYVPMKTDELQKPPLANPTCVDEVKFLMYISRTKGFLMSALSGMSFKIWIIGNFWQIIEEKFAIKSAKTIAQSTQKRAMP